MSYLCRPAVFDRIRRSGATRCRNWAAEVRLFVNVYEAGWDAAHPGMIFGAAYSIIIPFFIHPCSCQTNSTEM